MMDTTGKQIRDVQLHKAKIILRLPTQQAKFCNILHTDKRYWTLNISTDNFIMELLDLSGIVLWFSRHPLVVMQCMWYWWGVCHLKARKSWVMQNQNWALFWFARLLWNLSCTSAVSLQMCLSNFTMIWPIKIYYINFIFTTVSLQTK